jgi:hypothetical protein
MDTNRIPKHALQYKPKDEGTWDDQGRDGGTNFILRIKEQETRLILHELMMMMMTFVFSLSNSINVTWLIVSYSCTFVMKTLQLRSMISRRLSNFWLL